MSDLDMREGPPVEAPPDATAPAISRRQAVSLLGIAPLAGALEWNGVDVERAARFVRTLPATAATTSASTAYAPAFFVAHEWETLRMLVDYIIPRDERSGSATDARVPEYMDFLLAEDGASESSRVAMRGGLGWIDAHCRQRHGEPFIRCTDAQRRALLDDIAWPAKAPAELGHGVAFFNRLRDMTASGFFSSEIGWKDVQYMGHTFVPEWKGCPQPALDHLGVSYDLMSTRVPPQRP